jgi:hypothetical protein
MCATSALQLRDREEEHARDVGVGVAAHGSDEWTRLRRGRSIVVCELGGLERVRLDALRTRGLAA